METARDPILNISFETIIVPIRDPTGDHTYADDNLDNEAYENDWIIKADKLQVLDDLAFSLSTLELLKKPMYGQFCQLILTTKASNSSSGFYEGDDELLR